MPEISRFLGIIIAMYFKDHNPAHFHVKYNNHRAVIAINGLSVIEGSLPPRVWGLVMEWAVLHKGELLENWDLLHKGPEFNRIAPLA
ncbi:hypothetical protein FACS1894137_17310 [Spirochaetia bacterium]|nr:hypothetical protein FACS1894137_17310 [Spirochaetia bacterium]